MIPHLSLLSIKPPPVDLKRGCNNEFHPSQNSEHSQLKCVSVITSLHGGEKEPTVYQNVHRKMSICCDNAVLKVWLGLGIKTLRKTSCLLSVLQKKSCACCVTYMYRMQQMFCDDLPLGGWRHLTSMETKTKSSPHTVVA